MSVPAYDHRLVTENDRLVRWVAKSFRGFDSMDDLMQQGHLNAVLAGSLSVPDRPKSLSVAFWWEAVDTETKRDTMCAEVTKLGAGSAKPD